MAMAMTHKGHGVRKTNWPLWKRLAGYLNRISNMGSRLPEYGDEYRDAIVAVVSYKNY